LQTNDYEGSAQGGRDNLELGLSQTFANNNKLSVLARHTEYKNSYMENDTNLMVQYTIPLGLPVARKKSIGRIKGYVYDEETQSAIANVILRLNGSTAVTDKAGNFTFPSVMPGIYYLNVDTASIGMNRIPSRKTPIELAVRGGEKISAIIPVTRAAQLSGRIMVYGYEKNVNSTTPSEKPSGTNEPRYVVGKGSGYGEGDELVEDHGLANTIVELRNSSEVRRTVTDNQGRFEFEEMRPGKWTLKIYDDNLPEYHYLEKNTFEIELAPGEKKEMLIRVLPRKRTIQVIEEGETLIEEEEK